MEEEYLHHSTHHVSDVFFCFLLITQSYSTADVGKSDGHKRLYP